MLTTVEKLVYLRAVPVFRRVTLESLRALAEDLVVRTYPAGARVFGLGDPGDTLFVVTAGRVQIEQDAPAGRLERVAELGPGQHFGEVSLFSGTPRSAVATALEPTTLLALGREPLLALGAREPQVLVEALRVLSARLQDANADCG
jgi:CRP-like cAMP-binding protein